MATKTIPSREVLTCDRCGREGERCREGAFRLGGFHASVERWGTAWDGGTAGATTRIDLCSDCDAAFSEWMQAGRPTGAGKE